MKKILIFGLILIIIVSGFLYFFSLIQNFFHLKISEIETSLPKVVKLEKEISLPPPLKTEKKYPEKESPEVFLTKEGIIKWTNIQREKNNLPSLKENSKLNEMAKAKLEDMFLNQYFSHYAPNGEGIINLAEKFNYQFLIIGENLALGDFKDDKSLVDAWMASPGHRENILNKNYQEIGVAVLKGVFEGKNTWLAVQHFGLPLSVCPQPDLVLEKKIDENEEELERLEEEISDLKSEIQHIKRRFLEREFYLQKIEKYNNLVSQYNNLLEETKTLVNQYNSEVNLTNQCFSKFLKK